MMDSVSPDDLLDPIPDGVQGQVEVDRVAAKIGGLAQVIQLGILDVVGPAENA